MKKLSFCAILAAACLLAATAGLSRGQSSPSQVDVVDKMLATNKFDTFLELMRVADVTFNLKGSGPFTVFAPTDSAFEGMPGKKSDLLMKGKQVVKRFVLGHVVRGRWTATAAVKEGTLTTLAGTTLRTQTVNGRGKIGGAGFSIPNVNAYNGIIHGMDMGMAASAAR